jgi:hypothetical protein
MTTEKHYCLLLSICVVHSSPLQVVQLIGEHGIGKASLQPFKMPSSKRKLTLGELNDMLQARK